MYTHIRLDTTDSSFPFLYELASKSVILPKAEEYYNGVKHNKLKLLFAQNVIPIAEGITSVGYKKIIPALEIPPGSYLALLKYTYSDLSMSYADLALETFTADDFAAAGLFFDRVFEVVFSTSAKGYLGLTISGEMFLYTNLSTKWQSVSAPFSLASALVDKVTYANVILDEGQVTLICFPGHGIYKFITGTRVLERVTLTGNIAQFKIKSICSAYNYLILHDGQTIQWSSATDPLDFDLADAQITGTGFGVPAGIRGTIQFLISDPNGFTVYSDVNAVAVNWSGSIFNPWAFRVIANSAGIASPRHVVVSEDNTNIAWTDAGLMALTDQNATPIFPEVTDFFAQKRIDEYSTGTDLIQTTSYAGFMRISLALLESRYLAISYNVSESQQAVVAHPSANSYFINPSSALSPLAADLLVARTATAHSIAALLYVIQSTNGDIKELDSNGIVIHTYTGLTLAGVRQLSAGAGFTVIVTTANTLLLKGSISIAGIFNSEYTELSLPANFEPSVITCTVEALYVAGREPSTGKIAMYVIGDNLYAPDPSVWFKIPFSGAAPDFSGHGTLELAYDAQYALFLLNKSTGICYVDGTPVSGTYNKFVDTGVWNYRVVAINTAGKPILIAPEQTVSAFTGLPTVVTVVQAYWSSTGRLAVIGTDNKLYRTVTPDSLALVEATGDFNFETLQKVAIDFTGALYVFTVEGKLYKNNIAILNPAITFNFVQDFFYATALTAPA